MNTGAALPRHALWWLIGCQFYVILPHLTRVPLWVLAIYLGAALWRLQMHRERVLMPPRWLRLLLGLAAGGAVIASYQTLIGLDPMVALLLVASALKLIESVRAKDGYVLVSLGFFIMTTQFLYNQELPVALYSVVGTLLLVVSLIALNQRPSASISRREPLLALRMLGLAIPMMIVLFLLFPRIAPLWSVPSKNTQATTGMSGVLRPGDVTRLGRSAEVAFRVQFEDQIPPQRELYWRGMVLNQFADGAWRTLGWSDHPATERKLDKPIAVGDSLKYRIIIEPTMSHWLYAMPYAQSPTAGVFEAWDFRLAVRKPLESTFAYDVVTWPESSLQPELSPWRRETELALPGNLNPLTREWVERQVNAVGNGPELIARVLSYFREQPFYYTLQPPKIDDDDFVDQFIFQSLRGFCEHYAYSFVVMMRMAGIPARIIGGYQGGELNTLNNTLIVRQFDAHAWAEVWLDDQGWVRVDPTAAVAPERVEQGLEEALRGQEGFLADSLLSAYRFRGVSMVNWLRLRYDAAAWQWQSFIVGFNGDEQVELLESWFGEIKVSWFVAVLLGSWAVVLAPLIWWMNRSRSSSERLPVEEQFAALCRALARRGIERAVGESAISLLVRAESELPAGDPQLITLRRLIVELYTPINSSVERPHKPQ